MWYLQTGQENTPHLDGGAGDIEVAEKLAQLKERLGCIGHNDKSEIGDAYQEAL